MYDPLFSEPCNHRLDGYIEGSSTFKVDFSTVATNTVNVTFPFIFGERPTISGVGVNAITPSGSNFSHYVCVLLERGKTENGESLIDEECNHYSNMVRFLYTRSKKLY